MEYITCTLTLIQYIATRSILCDISDPKYDVSQQVERS